MPVRDSRNRKVPGLYVRNGRFYGLLWTEPRPGERKRGVRRPLFVQEGVPCTNRDEARAALEKWRVEDRDGKKAMIGRKPRLSKWVAEYLDLATTKDKKERTRRIEKEALARWVAGLGDPTLDKIATPALHSYFQRRLAGGSLAGKSYAPAKGRTVQLEAIALRNALKAAAEAGHLASVPKFPTVKADAPPRRALVTPAELDRLLGSCLATVDGVPVTKNGVQLRDYLRFLAFSGAREREALRVAWDHVDFAGGVVYLGAEAGFRAAAGSIGTGGTSKNRGSRAVDFSPSLRELLEEMKSRRAPDCSWLFPSPQRGERDVSAKTFRESLRLVRVHAGLPGFGFHDLRHFFCSHCVMAGIDFLTIAGWLGHKDGGILIGKVYGHLLDEHRKKMAAKLTLGGQETLARE